MYETLTLTDTYILWVCLGLSPLIVIWAVNQPDNLRWLWPMGLCLSMATILCFMPVVDHDMQTVYAALANPQKKSLANAMGGEGDSLSYLDLRTELDLIAKETAQKGGTRDLCQQCQESIAGKTNGTESVKSF